MIMLGKMKAGKRVLVRQNEERDGRSARLKISCRRQIADPEFTCSQIRWRIQAALKNIIDCSLRWSDFLHRWDIIRTGITAIVPARGTGLQVISKRHIIGEII